MPDSFIPYGPDPGTVARRSATAKLPSATRDAVTDVFHRDEVIAYRDRRIVTYEGTGQTFAIPGNAALAQPLLSIGNTTGSAVIISVRDIFVWSTAGAASATTFHVPWAYAFRTTTAPTGGTAVTKASTDSRESSSANATILQGASADGTASAITAAFVAPRMLGRPTSHYLTMAGVTPHMTPQDMMEGAPGDEVLLQAGQFFVVHAQAIAAADNAATRRWWVDYSWLEFTEY